MPAPWPTGAQFKEEQPLNAEGLLEILPILARMDTSVVSAAATRRSRCAAVTMGPPAAMVSAARPDTSAARRRASVLGPRSCLEGQMLAFIPDPK